MYKRKDKDKRMKTEELIKTALDELDQYQVRRYAQHLYNVRNALYKALELCSEEPTTPTLNNHTHIKDLKD